MWSHAQSYKKWHAHCQAKWGLTHSTRTTAHKQWCHFRRAEYKPSFTTQFLKRVKVQEDEEKRASPFFIK